ncbi:DUF1697 domain-containing protein [Enterococcus gilvus]|uniref:DUF1697 domain-containing protein n=1 Tax=Enterococcus gilvus TaxID=160453 RepID=UPI001C8BDC88|nr:DUF1697 domain-containing protein [Enterococcus gilvus]MBX8939183.1 DUF1697 domain-containing protein [Enterococcus gilvus]
MRYLALFRGINVGGKNIVKMKELRELFTELGFVNVRSYIQSGNLLFTSNKELNELSKLVTDAFVKKFGYLVPIIYRTKSEMLSMVQSLPFTGEELAEVESNDSQIAHLYVYFSGKEIAEQELSCTGERAVVRSKIFIILRKKAFDFQN